MRNVKRILVSEGILTALMGGLSSAISTIGQVIIEAFA